MTVLEFKTPSAYVKAKIEFKNLPKEELLLELADQYENEFPWKKDSTLPKLKALLDVVSERTSDRFVQEFVQDLRKELNV